MECENVGKGAYIACMRGVLSRAAASFGAQHGIALLKLMPPAMMI